MLSIEDQQLVSAAAAIVESRGDGSNHTVAAAARDLSGAIHVGLNLHHFTGGPCAELVVLALAASQSSGPLTTIVAVGDRGRGVLAPCGRCRQVMIDYFPDLNVIVPGDTVVAVRELLPHSYLFKPQEP